MEPDAFQTTDGVGMTAVTAQEMREVDRVAVEEVGLGLLQMMENAGRNLAARVGRFEPSRVTVFAGNGGNGGGGMACARHLANRGVAVEVVLDRPPEAFYGAAASQHRVLEAMGVPVSVGPIDHAPDGLVVDALVGYGLEGAIRGTARELVETVRAVPGRVVSLDVPAGMEATTGATFGPSVPADLVVTLALPKTGLRKLDGALVLADIGIPTVVFDRAGVPYDPPFRDGPLVELRQKSGE